MSKFQTEVQVVSNRALCERYYHLCLDAPDIVKAVRPGQFVHIRVHQGLEPFFRRPFSVFRAKRYLEFFYEPVGKGTRMLTEKTKGEVLDVLGPLGTPFSLPGDDVENVVMVAGGIGVAPFMMLSDFLKPSGKNLILLYGGRGREHVFDMKVFKKNGVKTFVTTDDGSCGVKGRVSKLFSKIPQSKTTMIYTCGPRPMMRAVQAFAERHDLRGEASCEEVMACGLGACLGCAIMTRQGYKTVCHDGPVFDLQDVTL